MTVYFFEKETVEEYAFGEEVIYFAEKISSDF